MGFVREIVFTLLLLITPLAHAQIYGPEAQEVNFSYSAKFWVPSSELANQDVQSLLELHGSHIFGYFQSEYVLNNFGLESDLVGGIGAPQIPLKYSSVKQRDLGDDKIEISYRASGKMILHKAAAKKILGGKDSAGLQIELPYDLTHFYNKKCTDDHYDTQGDFWYFYDPFRQGCQYLRSSPMAEPVVLTLSQVTTRKLDMDARLDLLRGNNANGPLFRVDMLFGYSESPKDPNDDGKRLFGDVRDYFTQNGFKEKIKFATTTRPLATYTKTVGDKTFEANVRLVESGIDSKTVTFAKSFKDSVENADVLIYNGHSGLGGNLDIGSLEQKAGGFQFNPNKRQIFFFDSCSSYSYYLDAFRDQKSRARLDVITNGLVSYYDKSVEELTNFLDFLFDENRKSATWDEILKKMEEPLNGQTYLLNVGGI